MRQMCLSASKGFRVKRAGKSATPSPVKGNSYYDQAIAAGAELQLSDCSGLLIDEVSIYGEPSSTIWSKRPNHAAPSSRQGLDNSCAWGPRDTLDRERWEKRRLSRLPQGRKRNNPPDRKSGTASAFCGPWRKEGCDLLLCRIGSKPQAGP